MPDLIDHAQDVEEMHRNQAIADRAARKAEVPRMNGAARVCLVCEEAIEAQRIAANPQAVRCVECQQRQERGGR